MNKTNIIVLLLLIFGFNSYTKAQINLVPNPSFEDTLYCPVTLADLSATTFWNAPTQGSPDYFNACSSNTNINVPNNAYGNQPAKSGNSYVGVSVYESQNINSYREYIQVQLKQQLLNGKKYFISFYVSLSDYNDYGIKELGASFSTGQIVNNTMDSTLSIIPLVQFSDYVITDKNNWTKINGSFIANGTENFLIIGNFNKNAVTTATQVSNNNISYAYYYIDDVCLSDDSTVCDNPIGITEYSNDNIFAIYPNPTNDLINIKSKTQTPFNLSIYNSIGELIHSEESISLDHYKINISNQNAGLILINIQGKDKNYIYKLLKQ